MSDDVQKKTILVTGGAGFIGSYLCERLAKGGHHVISLDNYFTGSLENHVPGVDYREGHTKDIDVLVPERLDYLYHFGEYARVRQSLEEPHLVWDMNMSGTLAVLEYWRRTGVKLLYSGSSTKFTEARDDGVLGRDLAPYTWAKAAISDLVVDYGRWYALPFSIVYFYNVYGPRERTVEHHGTVVATFLEKRKKGEPLVVASPGTQRRCFTHVEDTVDGIILAAEHGEGDGYSIGAKESYSLLELASMVGGDVVMGPQTESTRSSGEVDTSKIEMLGWKQKHTLPDYLAHARITYGL